MNALSYALLSMLVRKPCSGYELMKLLQAFWQAKHSQIYPLLAKLEKEQLVTFEHIGQTGKPDKKIYSLTEAGTAALREWIDKQPASLQLERDEFLIKLYAIGVTEPHTAIKLFEERREAMLERMHRLEAEIQLMESEPMPVMNYKAKQFGRYLLYQRRVRLLKEEMAWIEWVLPMLIE